MRLAFHSAYIQACIPRLGLWTGMGSVDEVQVKSKDDSVSFVVKTVGDLLASFVILAPVVLKDRAKKGMTDCHRIHSRLVRSHAVNICK